MTTLLLTFCRRSIARFWHIREVLHCGDSYTLSLSRQLPSWRIAVSASFVGSSLTHHCLQTSLPSSPLLSLWAQSSTTPSPLLSLRPSSVTPITVLKPQTPKKSFSSRRRLLAPPPLGVHQLLAAPSSRMVSEL